jgi:ABC-2 type transport system permease protein
MTSASPLVVLVRRSFSRAAAVFAAVTGVLAGFQVLMVLVATSLQQSRSFDLVSALVPMTVQRAFGPGAFMMASFPGIVTFGYFHPIVVLALIQWAVYLATEPAGEVEWGLFDLELSRAVARHRIVTRTVVVAFGLTGATVALMMGATWLGLAALAPAGAEWPAAGRVASLGAHLVLLAWGFAAAGLAAAAFARRRGTAFATVAVATVVLYMLNFLADVWEPARRVRWATPFHYYPGLSVANGTAPVAHDLAVLSTAVVALTLLAYWQFSRRDL